MGKSSKVLVPVFLAVQGLFAYFVASREDAPAPPVLSGFPAGFNGWSKVADDRLDPGVVNELHADQLLGRTYWNRATDSTAGLFVAWFQSQRDGTRQPHSPQVCLPGSGWVPVQTGEVSLETEAGAITANRLVVASRDQRAVVLYWYQNAHRATAGEWASKFWVLADGLRYRRTDTALVRVVVFSQGRSDEATAHTAITFASGAYPLLRSQLPL